MRLRTRIFKRTRALVERLPPGAGSIHSLLWLHLLSSGDLDDVTIDSYDRATDSGFGSEGHNLRGVWPWEEKIFRSWVGHRHRVLVAGAGGGREMIALARMGFSVSGFDASADLVSACQANLASAGVTGEIIHAPPGMVPDGQPDHDALVVGRGVYHHIPGRARRISFLEAARRRLKSGSPVAIGDCHMRTAPSRLSRFAVRTAIEQGDSIADAFNHRFTEAELVTELELAGFVRPEVHATPFPGVDHLCHATAWAPPIASRIASGESLEEIVATP